MYSDDNIKLLSFGEEVLHPSIRLGRSVTC